MKQETELLTAQELAKRLSISTETVRAWTRRGLIPALRMSPKVIRYQLEAVLDALAERAKGEAVSHE